MVCGVEAGANGAGGHNKAEPERTAGGGVRAATPESGYPGDHGLYSLNATGQESRTALMLHCASPRLLKPINRHTSQLEDRPHQTEGRP